MKEVEIKMKDDALTILILCELDHHTAKTVRETADREIRARSPREIILDFSGVTFMDSSGIGLIMGRASEASKIGARVTVKGLSPMLDRLVRMAGVEKIRGVRIGMSK